MKYLIFILLQGVSSAILAQKVGQIPHYADFSDFAINIEGDGHHTFGSVFTDSSKLSLGSDIKLGVSYKPKNSLVGANLYAGLCLSKMMPLGVTNGVSLSYSTLGLSAIYFPNRNGNWFAQIGGEYCTLNTVESVLPDFFKKENFEKKYWVATAQIGIKAIQYKQFSLWLQTGYKHALTPIWFIPTLNYQRPDIINYTPLYLADLQLGITLKYHTSEYYAKK
jgi:hypothetical protein